jgi:hypothetical protein
MIPRIITDTSVAVHLDGDILTANSSHPAFDQIKAAAQAQDWDTVRSLIDIKTAVAIWSGGNFTIEGDVVLYQGEAVPSQLEARIIGFLQDEAPFEYLLKFYENLIQNPSNRSIQELYAFLEHESIPIGEDGCFYAYKSVRADLGSWHVAPDGQPVPNVIGSTVSMERRFVDDDANRGCSHGYHVGSLAYAGGFNSGNGQRVLICRINPKDVVSVPHDCQHQKVRTCSYDIVQEYTGPLPSVFWSPDVVPYEDDEGYKVCQLEDQIASAQDELDRLQTAINAAIDAEVEEAVAALANAVADVQHVIDTLQEELGGLIDDSWEEEEEEEEGDNLFEW